VRCVGVPCLQTNLQPTPAGWEDISTDDGILPDYTALHPR